MAQPQSEYPFRLTGREKFWSLKSSISLIIKEMATVLAKQVSPIAVLAPDHACTHGLS